MTNRSYQTAYQVKSGMIGPNLGCVRSRCLERKIEWSKTYEAILLVKQVISTNMHLINHGE